MALSKMCRTPAVDGDIKQVLGLDEAGERPQQEARVHGIQLVGETVTETDLGVHSGGGTHKTEQPVHYAPVLCVTCVRVILRLILSGGRGYVVVIVTAAVIRVFRVALFLFLRRVASFEFEFQTGDEANAGLVPARPADFRIRSRWLRVSLAGVNGSLAGTAVVGAGHRDCQPARPWQWLYVAHAVDGDSPVCCRDVDYIGTLPGCVNRKNIGV